MNLPPVPENLRTLARQQLANEPTVKLRCLRKLLRHQAEEARRMQEVILQRTKPAGSLPHVDGGWANAGEWQKLLAEFDKVVAALRTAWQEVKDTEPAVQEVLRTWREVNSIDPDLIINEDSEEFWLLLSPAVEQAMGNSWALITTANTQWGVVVAKYFKMLQNTKAIRPLHPGYRSATAA